jgi:8-oxo-dGTP pyrophosphatase MutT (NUDIX family)
MFIEVSVGELQDSQDQSIKIYRNFKLTNSALKSLRDEFLNPLAKNSIMIQVASFKEFLKELRKLFYYIEAAGGFIVRDANYLFIHRHGRWDLPKGKLEKKETIENAAVRECEEECGIRNLMIQKPLGSTFHIYAYKDGYALKQTFWFYMTTNYAGDLVAQTEEDIDQAKWFPRDEVISAVLPDTYYTIADVVREALEL